MNTCRTFVAELSLYVPELQRSAYIFVHFAKSIYSELHARAEASNKKSAAASCALSMVRQLFHLKIIPPFEGGTGKKKSDGEQVCWLQWLVGYSVFVTASSV